MYAQQAIQQAYDMNFALFIMTAQCEIQFYV